MAPVETTEPPTDFNVVVHEKSDQPADASQDALPKSAQSSEPSIEDEPVPHLHAKTFLIVFAVCFIYFAQLINVVGAGAVSTYPKILPEDGIPRPDVTNQLSKPKRLSKSSAVPPIASG